MSNIKIFSSEEELGKAAADFMVALSKKSIAEHGVFTIALSGGSTPNKLFELLAADAYNKQIDWKNSFVFWGDERYLPETDENNNSHQARKILLNNVSLPIENIFPIPVKMEPAKAAIHYQQTLLQFFKSDKPAFDLIMLGMGDNGHTASLFPHTTILQETTALVKEVYVEEVNMYRISFTAGLINHAKNILFLVSGDKKADMLKTVLEGEKSIEKYPAQMIKAEAGNNVYWYIDKTAAAQLQQSPA